MVGFSDVQARLGLTMLPRLDPAAAVRVRNADSLDRSLAGIPGVATQAVPAGGRSIRWNYPMLIPDRDRVLPDVRRASGFDLAPGYTPDLSAIPAFREYSCPCPVAARADATHVYVPVHPDLAPGTFEAAADRLANVLRAVT
jgi:dTDP-4-amino-4,6-dideoxygalactose transaminase